MGAAASELPEGDVVAAALADVDANVNTVYKKLKDDLIKFYRIHAPSKITLVDRLVEHYGESKKKTTQLWAKLHSKYSNAPRPQDRSQAQDKDRPDAHSQDKNRVRTKHPDKPHAQNKHHASSGEAAPAVFSHISVQPPAPDRQFDVNRPVPMEATFGAGDVIDDLREKLKRMRARAEDAEVKVTV